MNKCSKAIGILTVVLAGASAWAGTASAASRTTNSTVDIISELSRQGYDVQLNGQPNSGLEQCTVTGVHQIAKAPTDFGTAYVDLDCPGGD
ncbi:hypothetical protein OG976_16955 [Mycobacterium sp. NBC_00419]|uniref:hypothetical protein n=1 Tax=Mycobacterium sp. NBC_00419 TaxID=2975989 RepID=UPI002E1AB696